MTHFKSSIIPDDPENLPPARRRRARRMLTPVDAGDRASALESLAHRASPSFDFFLFSLLSGAGIAVGFLLDEPALLVLGVLLAPLMGPAVGLSLGTVVGSLRFFFRSLIGLAIGSLFVFAIGYLAGFVIQAWSQNLLNIPVVSGPWLSLELTLAHRTAQLSWPVFLLLALGAGLASAALARSEKNATLPSVALAYGLYLPLSAAGIGLGSGMPNLWPDGLVVFALHMAWAVLIGAIILAVLGFRPLTLFGYTLGGVLILLGVVLSIALGGAGAVFGARIALPTQSPTATSTSTVTSSPSDTPIPPSATLTSTMTTTSTATATGTVTPSPTPILALVVAGESGGAHLRAEPSFESTSLAVLPNGTILQVFPDQPVEEGGGVWVHVQTQEELEGWILQSLLATATPAPNWS